jgi:hypothetical protein
LYLLRPENAYREGMRLRALVPVLLAAGLVGGCGGGKSSSSSTTTPATTTAAAATTTAVAAAAAHRTVWLCFPGKAPDPCASSLETTVVHADGTTSIQRPKLPVSPPIDCFYVYPTVSNEDRGNADLTIGLPQIIVAETQAARFSQVCKVYAPVYRQITDQGLTTPSLHANPLLAYGDVLAAWRDYLAHDNHGRGVVLIGHSQGAYVLKHLLSARIDRLPAERRLLVSAILLGGQVHDANGKGSTGDFRHVPPCSSATAIGCVIAYSSFNRVPPPNAMFGRSRIPGTHIACVNPASPGSTAAEPVTALFPAVLMRFVGASGSAPVATPWVAYPDLYTARCERQGTASWLQIDRLPQRPGDARPVLRPMFGAGWGLHATDVNVALANLVDVVGSQAHAYEKQR